MNLVIASGESLRSKVWAEQEVIPALTPYFDRIELLEYEHWQLRRGETDLDGEARELARLAESIGSPYAIFAKSIGTIVTLKAIKEYDLKPEQATFVGMPLEWMYQQEVPVDDWLAGLDVHSLFVQNMNDPAAGYGQVRRRLHDREVENYSLLELPGNTHDYEVSAIRHEMVQTFNLSRRD